jgi:transposase
MKNQKYNVKLTNTERKKLQRFIKSKSQKNTAECKKHAKVIMYLDENSKNPLSVRETSKKCKLHYENVYKIRKQFCTEGMDRVLYRKKRKTPPVPPKVTGEVEAHIIATACSEPPSGRKAWTLSLIADKIVLEGVVDSISTVSVMNILKKRNISLT